MPGIVEQTLLEQQNIDLNEMVTMNQMIDQLLPNASKELQQKLKIKIYNFVRTRKQPSITVRRRKYFKPAVAKLIIGNVQDYADAIERRAKEAPAKEDATDKRPASKSKRVKTITKRKILAKVIKNDKIDKSIQKKLEDKIASIVKTNFIKPVNKRGSFSVEDGEKVIAELSPFYQNIKLDQKYRKNAEKAAENKETETKEKPEQHSKDQNESREGQSKDFERKNNQKNSNNRNNNNQTQNQRKRQNKHPFEIRRENNNRSRNNQSNRRYNNRNNYDNRNNYEFDEASGLRERYNTVIRNYNQLEQRYNALQDKYNQALDDKARLIEEMGKKNEDLRRVLIDVLRKM